MFRAVLLVFMGAIAMLPVTAQCEKREATPPPLHAPIPREWQYHVEHSPTYASVSGDRRWNDRWDDLSLKAIETDHQHNLQVVAQVKKLDRKKLSAADQLNSDLFLHDYELWIEEHRFKTYL